jgi:hypothetical protein
MQMIKKDLPALLGGQAGRRLDSLSNAGKTFDAVKMMREIREKISAETQNMNFEEFKVYIKQHLSDNKTKVGHT